MKYRFLLLSALSITTFLTSCSGGWTDEDKKQYLQSCYEGQAGRTYPDDMAKEYCECALEKTMQVYPHFNDIVENQDSTRLTALYDSCANQIIKP